jgi:hypothetical protein
MSPGSGRLNGEVVLQLEVTELIDGALLPDNTPFVCV